MSFETFPSSSQQIYLIMLINFVIWNDMFTVVALKEHAVNVSPFRSQRMSLHVRAIVHLRASHWGTSTHARFLWSRLMLLLSVSMSWICFRNAVLNPLYVGKATYSNKEKFGILEDNLKPPLPSSSESRSSPILAIEVAPKKESSGSIRTPWVFFIKVCVILWFSYIIVWWYYIS